MNCLALAVSDETNSSPLTMAQIYYDWVIKGERGVKVTQTGTKECEELLKESCIVSHLFIMKRFYNFTKITNGNKSKH
jgi:hypothetical protein